MYIFKTCELHPWKIWNAGAVEPNAQGAICAPTFWASSKESTYRFCSPTFLGCKVSWISCTAPEMVFAKNSKWVSRLQSWWKVDFLLTVMDLCAPEWCKCNTLFWEKCTTLSFIGLILIPAPKVMNAGKFRHFYQFK